MSIELEMEHSKAKTITVIVNGRPREIEKHDRDLTYLEVIQLAFPGEEPTDQIVFTVTYSSRNGKEGSLVAGESVKAKDEMIFNVGKTDLS